MPDRDRSSLGIFLPDAYNESRSLSGGFGESLMPDHGQGFVKVTS